MKTIKTWLTTIAALLCSITASAHDFEVNGVYYNIISDVNGTAEVTFKGESHDEYNEYSGAIDIPSIVNYNGKTYSVIGIGEWTFWACSGLTSVNLPNSVASIGSYAFYYSGLTSITVPNSVTEIESCVFSGCSNLLEITIPNSIIKIGTYAFYGCTGLTSVTIPNSVTSIEGEAFGSCSGLKKIYCESETPPSITTGYQATFNNTLNNVEAIYVPIGAKNLYDKSYWNQFSNILEYTVEVKRYILSFIIDGEVYKTESLPYEATIASPETPTKEGHTFSGWSEIPETMPANDVTVTGTFTVNNYTLTYIIDGVVYDTKSVAYGSEIIMLEAPEKSGYTFDGWDRTLAVMPAENVVINGSYSVENFVITDGSDSEFISEEDLQYNKITYTRTLSKVNTWNALYVPFEIPVTAEFLENYDVAYFNDIHSYDEYIGEKEDGVSGQDGVIDRMDMEVLKVQEGATLNANYPYLIRAKNEGALNMTITVEDATLYETVETTVSCSSVFMRFDVTGIYTTQTAGELKGEFDVYAMSGGGWKQALSESQQLKPFRLYLSLSTIDGSPVKVAQSAMKAIRIRVDGEDETTEIDNSVIRMDDSEMIFDLQGRRVENPTKGIYIVNGKKVLY